MIAVRVSDDDAGELLDLRGEQLLPKVGPAIDQHALAGALDQDRGAQARVARLGGIALAPLVPDLRHAGRRAAAEDPDLHACLGLS